MIELDYRPRWCFMSDWKTSDVLIQIRYPSNSPTNLLKKVPIVLFQVPQICGLHIRFRQCHPKVIMNHMTEVSRDSTEIQRKCYDGQYEAQLDQILDKECSCCAKVAASHVSMYIYSSYATRTTQVRCHSLHLDLSPVFSVALEKKCQCLSLSGSSSHGTSAMTRLDQASISYYRPYDK